MIFSNFRFNFDPVTAIAVDFGGKLWDLHNDTFLGFQYSTVQHHLKMSWAMSVHDAAYRPELEGRVFEILFHNVVVLEVGPRDSEMPLNEDECLTAVGYIAPDQKFDEWCQRESIGSYSPNVGYDDWHLVFRFWGGQVIRVGAESASASISVHPGPD
jgi:hypothetical protein